VKEDGVEGTQVQLVISAYAEKTTPREIELYGSAVKFLSYWFMKQDGVMNKGTPELFDEFKQNVCAAMAAGSQGTG